MKTANRVILTLATMVPLSGCGQHLGDYGVEEVRVVSEIPSSYFGSPSPQYGRYLQIDVASSTDLTSFGRKIDAVYVNADFCPLRNRNGLIAFGPYGNDGQDLGLPNNAKRLKAGKDGLYRYRVFVAVASTAERVTRSGQLQLPTYDLQLSNRDLCVQLFAPGYNLIKSQSKTIRVRADVVASAIE